MIVRCTSCNAAYSVEDSKVGNKIFAFNCPKCSTENIIDNRVKAQKAAEEIREEKYSRTPDAGADEFRFEEDRGPKEEIFAGKAREGAQKSSFAEETADFSFEEKKSPSIPPEEELIAFDDEDFQTAKGKDIFDELGGEIEEKGKKKSPGLEDELPKEEDFEFADDLILDEEPQPSAGKKDQKGKNDFGDLDLDSLASELDDFEKESQKTKQRNEPANDDFIIENDLILEDEPPVSGQDSERAPAEKPGKTSVSEELILDDDLLLDELEDLGDKKGRTGAHEFEENLPESDIDVTEIKNEEIYSSKKKEDEDNITIDLDSLDIDLEEDKSAVLEGEIPAFDEHEEPLVGAAVASKPKGKKVSDEEDITLDLDDLDIPLEMSDDIKQGEVVDADEKLTLEDAGLTIDELTSEEITEVTKSEPTFEFDEEDIKLTIDDIDPNLNVENIENEIIDNQEDIKLTIDEIDPELNVHNIQDKIGQESMVAAGAVGAAGAAAGVAATSLRSQKKKSIDDEEMLLLDEDLERKGSKRPEVRAEDDFINLEEDEFLDEERDSIGYDEDLASSDFRGTVDFSIDYSINYSRVGAVLRLLCLYFIALIPHLLVFLIYSLLSGILGFINNIVILSSGRAMLDFWAIQQNTVRYMISLGTSFCGIVEEAPHFAGRDDIDFALQYGVRYPQRPSRLLAFLRLSIVGINLMVLPHILILMLLSIASPFFYIAGLFSILFTAKMPRLIFNFISSYYRYIARVISFVTGLVDEYPPFKF